MYSEASKRVMGFLCQSSGFGRQVWELTTRFQAPESISKWVVL